MPPVAFVMCGNFLSKPHGGQSAAKLKGRGASSLVERQKGLSRF